MQLCEKETLDFGIAFYSSDFAALPEANQFREVCIEDEVRIPTAFDQAESWFTKHGLTCHKWAPAQGMASDQLSGFLQARGFARCAFQVVALREWVEFDETPDVRILPARAMRQAFRDTFSRSASAPTPEQTLVAQAAELRLDDPQFDMYVAVVDRQPAGRGALYQIGDIARVVDLDVLPGFEFKGVENALLAHIVAMAKRLQFRTVLAQIPTADAQRAAWFRRAGFGPDGEIVEFGRSVLVAEPQP
mgnify:CR=1 FL=1